VLVNTIVFDAGAVCPDFAHTGGEGGYAIFESLHEPADLADWLAQPPPAAVVTVPVTARDLAAAKAVPRRRQRPRNSPRRASLPSARSGGG